MFGAIRPTQFDVQFVLFGIPVRIHVTFWIIAFLLSFLYARGEDIPLLILCTVCVLISILTHEMGHALASKFFGVHSVVLLYYAGGLAASQQQLPRWKNVAMIFAGPLAGLVQACFLVGIYVAVKVAYPDFDWGVKDGHKQLQLMANAGIFLIVINVIWSLFNLLPVYPMDGGQIAREIITWLSPRSGVKYSLILSMVTCAALLAIAIPARSFFIIIFMAQFGYMNYQEYQQITQNRRRF